MNEEEYGALVEWCWPGDNRSSRRRPCPSATFITKNLTWTGLGSNPGLCGERTATKRLRRGTTF